MSGAQAEGGESVRVKAQSNKPDPAGRDGNPFALDLKVGGPVLRLTLRLTRPLLEHVLKLCGVERIYTAARDDCTGGRFPDRVLRTMNLDYEVDPEDLARIPLQGPVVVVANHPFGGVEGLVLDAVINTVRSDSRVMANFLLGRIPELRDSFILVDPFGSKASRKKNVAPLKEAVRWLRDDGLLGIFPAGEVSHVDWRNRRVCDPPWSRTVAGLIRRTGAQVVPLFFEGHNSAFFQLAGLVHARVRTVLLPQELLNKQNRTIRLYIGNPITHKKVAGFDNDEEMIEYLRMRTYLLAGRGRRKRTARARVIARRARHHQQEPVAAPLAPERIQADVANLPASQCLHQTAEFAVYYAVAEEIPNLLQEIGRCREITFREVGEGTGLACDLDRFDKHYVHLFVWSRKNRELVGAYRLGLVDTILREHGIRGLYTRTLFRFGRRFLKQIQPSVELGRSFVRPEYQRVYTSLMLLWKGIGLFITQHPHYTSLFGPVSITNDYTDASRHLLVRALRLCVYEPMLGKLVRPRHPPRRKGRTKWPSRSLARLVPGVEDVSELIQELESDGKGVPILLKQYLKLGGKLIAFNVDTAFSSVLDALIAVDLRRTDPRILIRYMGRERAEGFMRYHNMLPADESPEPTAAAAAE